MNVGVAQPGTPDRDSRENAARETATIPPGGSPSMRVIDLTTLPSVPQKRPHRGVRSRCPSRADDFRPLLSRIRLIDGSKADDSSTYLGDRDVEDLISGFGYQSIYPQLICEIEPAARCSRTTKDSPTKAIDRQRRRFPNGARNEPP